MPESVPSQSDAKVPELENSSTIHSFDEDALEKDHASSSFFSLIARLPGVILCIASLLKAYQILTDPYLMSGLATYPYLMIALSGLELAIGIWLVSGVLAKQARLVGIFVFMLFSLLSLYKLLVGAESCGCFGKIVVHPGWTLALDLISLGIFLKWRPPESRLAVRHLCILVASFLSVVLMLTLAGEFAVAQWKPATLGPEGEIEGPSEYVLIQPHDWVGHTFPLLDYVEGGKKLSHGKWIIVLYHRGCPYCRQEIMTLEQFAIDNRHAPSRPQIAFIEVPLPREVEADSHGCLDCAYLSLGPSRKWLAATPLVAELQDGKVISLRTGNVNRLWFL
jgi:hypothetical protein